MWVFCVGMYVCMYVYVCVYFVCASGGGNGGVRGNGCSCTRNRRRMILKSAVEKILRAADTGWIVRLAT